MVFSLVANHHSNTANQRGRTGPILEEMQFSDILVLRSLPNQTFWKVKCLSNICNVGEIKYVPVGDNFYEFLVLRNIDPAPFLDSTQDFYLNCSGSGNSLAIQWLALRAFTARGPGSVSGWGTKIPQAIWCGQKEKKRNCAGSLTAYHLMVTRKLH